MRILPDFFTRTTLDDSLRPKRTRHDANNNPIADWIARLTAIGSVDTPQVASSSRSPGRHASVRSATPSSWQRVHSAVRSPLDGCADSYRARAHSSPGSSTAAQVLHGLRSPRAATSRRARASPSPHEPATPRLPTGAGPRSRPSPAPEARSPRLPGTCSIERSLHRPIRVVHRLSSM